MTYVSRRTRIIVSRWLDECDVEYRLQACRKRSDGRLKRYSSCDDIRAWINDNCVKHEYLADLMSNGGFSGSSPFRLFGRFVPVPVLFQLAQNSKTAEGEEEQKANARRAESTTNVSFARREGKYGESLNCDELEDSKTLSNSNLVRIEWEKNQLEKSLLKCTCLLNKAVKKLENIDGIVEVVEGGTACEERQQELSKSKVCCSCSALSNSNNGERFHLRRSRDSNKCNELLRKISGLREKLKRIQECRNEISQQIMSLKRRSVCTDSQQVTELYNHGDAHVKKLQKKLERLIAERGKHLSEMCQTLTSLNNIKRSSRSNMSFRKRDSKAFGSTKDFHSETLGEAPTCKCGWKCLDNDRRSFDSTRHSFSATSSEFSENEFSCKKRKQTGHNSSSEFHSRSEDSSKYGNREAEKFNFGYDSKKAKQRKSKNINSDVSNASTLTLVKEGSKFLLPDQAAVDEKKTKRSKVKFVCPRPPCREKFDADDLAAFEGSLSKEQQAMVLGVLQSIKQSRPSTSPTTQRERRVASTERNGGRQYNGGYNLDRRVKSETTMKEIEKTLRDYQWRLGNLESLEGKVEQMKDKLSETERLKKSLAQAKMQRAADREKTEREMARLCSENWELKKQVQQLAAKYSEQSKKIVNLKCDAMRARELECQAEELKKELSEYRDGFEHQRKCITKWESVVAVQRTEIENLMNHIRKLTTVDPGEEEVANDNAYNERRYVQRSRSYSPEMVKKKGFRNWSSANAGMMKSASDDDDIFCLCDDCPQQDCRRTSHMAGSGYCSSNRRREWCN